MPPFLYLQKHGEKIHVITNLETVCWVILIGL